MSETPQPGVAAGQATFVIPRVEGVSQADPEDQRVEHSEAEATRLQWLEHFQKATEAGADLYNPGNNRKIGMFLQGDPHAEDMLELWDATRKGNCTQNACTLTAGQWRALISSPEKHPTAVALREKGIEAIPQGSEDEGKDLEYEGPGFPRSTLEPRDDPQRRLACLGSAGTRAKKVLILGDSGAMLFQGNKVAPRGVGLALKDAGFMEPVRRITIGVTIQTFVEEMAHFLSEHGKAVPVQRGFGEITAAANATALDQGHALIILWNFNDFTDTVSPVFAQHLALFCELIRYWPHHLVVCAPDHKLWRCSEEWGKRAQVC